VIEYETTVGASLYRIDRRGEDDHAHAGDSLSEPLVRRLIRSIDWRELLVNLGAEQRQWPRKRNPQAIQQG
jgi:hypothetical protein